MNKYLKLTFCLVVLFAFAFTANATHYTYINTQAGKKVYLNTTGSNKGRSSIAGPTSGLVGYWSFNGPDTDWSL